MSFHEKIKMYREQKGYSQEQLARLIDENKTKTMVYNWEQRNNFPEVETLLALSVILDVSLDTLFEDELAYLRKENKPSEDPFPGITAGLRILAERLQLINEQLYGNQRKGGNDGDREESQ